jgi:hypothetical protein
VGASGIGAGIAYAQSCHPNFLIIDVFTFCLYIGAIFTFVFVRFAAKTKRCERWS